MRCLFLCAVLALTLEAGFCSRSKTELSDEFDLQVGGGQANRIKVSRPEVVRQSGGYFEVTNYKAVPNPCDRKRCKSGMECSLNHRNLPECECVSRCPETTSVEETVCGTNNVTYSSLCELYRAKCIGKSNKKTRKAFKRLKIDYYGSCQKLPSCKKRDIREYPSRMRSWIKNIFLQAYDTPSDRGGLRRKERALGEKISEDRYELQHLEEGSMEMLDAKFDLYYKDYIFPIHWKFSQLDRSRDGQLSKRELEPLRAPLIPMEHCTKLFFKRADKDKNKMISFEEWGLALGLKQGDMENSMLD